MNKALFLFIFMSICTVCLQAQIDYSNGSLNLGFRGGIGLSKLTGLDKAKQYGLPDVSYSIADNFAAKPKFVWDIGFSLQYTVPYKYFIQMDMLCFSDGGSKLKGVGKDRDSDITSINICSFQLKSYLGKKIDLNKEGTTRLVVGGGPYLAYLFSGYGGSSEIYYRDVYDEEYGYWYEESYSAGGDEPRINRIEVGASILAGIEYKNIQVALNFDLGLTKVLKDSHFDSRNMALKLAFTIYI